jgi:hypothetical protein
VPTRRTPRWTSHIGAGGLLLTLALGGAARAGESPQLILPLLTALALGQTVATAQAEREQNPIRATVNSPPAARLSFLPTRLRIPDLYAIELERDPARFAAPIDADTMVAFDLWNARPKGPRVSVAYDTESPLIGESSDVLRFEVEIGF